MKDATVFKNIAVEKLLLDDCNPRLPKSLHNKSEAEIIKYLLLEDVFPYTSTDWTNVDYPTTSFVPAGSHSDPFTTYGDDFHLDHKVKSDGNVTIVATQYIELLSGFEVEDGAECIVLKLVYIFC